MSNIKKILITSFVIFIPVLLIAQPNIKWIGNIKSNPPLITTGDIVTFEAVFSVKIESVNHLKVIGGVDDSTELFNKTFPQINKGNWLTVNFNWKATIGKHKVWFKLDPDETIPDQDKSDNQTEKLILVKDKAVIYTGKPDLQIGSIKIIPSLPALGSKFTIIAPISNKGTVEAKASSAELVYKYVGGTSTTYPLSVPSIPANKSHKIIKVLTAVPSAIEIEILADVKNDVSESNETNNEKSFPIKFQAQTSKADLIIEKIELSPPNPAPNSQVTFIATVKNIGATKADTSTAEFIYKYEDGTATYYPVSTPAIDPNSSVKISKQTTAVTSAKAIEVVADTKNVIDESNEMNNSKALGLNFSVFSLYEGKPDLIVQEIMIQPPSPVLNSQVTFIATIKNLGSVKAPASTAEFRYKYEGTSYTGYPVPTPEIPANGQVVISKQITAVASARGMEVIADKDNAVDESSETNNSKSITFIF